MQSDSERFHQWIGLHSPRASHAATQLVWLEWGPLGHVIDPLGTSEGVLVYWSICAFTVTGVHLLFASSFPRLNPESSTHMSTWSMSGIFGKTKWMKVTMI